MYIDINGARLFFDVAGSHLDLDGEKEQTKPVFLILHGGPGMDYVSMRPFFDRFADECLVVYLNHRGNGRSRGLAGSDPATWNLPQWGDDIAAFCDALGFEKPIIFGQSFGGMVAQSYGARHPGHAGGIVFSSTAARMILEDCLDAFETVGGKDARKAAEAILTSSLIDDDKTYEAIFERFVKVCLPVYTTTKQTFIPRHAIIRKDVGRHFGAVGQEQWSMDLRGMLNKVTSPALVLCSDKDPITPTVRSREILEALPKGAEFIEVKNAGHGAYRDRPEETEAILRKFIARCAA